MSYASGEVPVLGDHVINQWGQPGRVTRVYKSKDDQEYIDVSWDDGGISLLSAPAADFKLLARSS